MAIARPAGTPHIWLSVTGAVIFGLLVISARAVDHANTDDESISRELSTIMRRSFEKEADFSAGERDSLHLLGEKPRSSDKAKVYRAIAGMYAKAVATYSGKVAEYCELAMQNQQSAHDACQLYSDWGLALEVRAQAGKDIEAFADARRRIIKPYLRALNLAIVNQAPEKEQPLPYVGKFDYSGSKTDGAYLAMVKKHDEQMSARERAIDQNKLVECRDTIIDRIVRLYSRPLSEVEELRQAASQELHSQAAIDDLIKKVQEQAGSTSPPRSAK